MLDSHCHLDLYQDPSSVADRAEAAGVFTVMVTNLPSAFERSRPYVAGRKSIRLALGLHPLMADQHKRERQRFELLAQETSFIGEVGLDFSIEGISTAEIQFESFEFVLRTLAQSPKFISIHSRKAEARVLELLKNAKRSPAVFHWYTGPLKTLDEALNAGHYFSINPSMLRSKNGQKIIAAIPRNRVLTETDGPFVTVKGVLAEPADVRIVEEQLALLWKVTHSESRRIVAENFLKLIDPLRR
jgi:TatD DNase family protein